MATPERSTRDKIEKLFQKGFTGLHRFLYTRSNGRLIGKAFGMPVLTLTTTGRKSGEPRVAMLTSPVHDDERVILVASNNGNDRAPGWFHNLVADPLVEIVMAGETRAMTARVATAEEKADLWPKIVAAYKGYAGYQKKTDRDIPVVICTPRS